jgi:nicotinamide mononucleotide adenylyltransferase
MNHSPSTTISDVGVIHGRFQVLHNDHIKYILAGKAHCRSLIIGITNPDPMYMKKEDSDPVRTDPLANPLTYYERMVMITEALNEQGVSSNEFSVVPFPVNFPDMYRYYVPMEALFFLTIYDTWGKKKLDYFKSLGLHTHILWEVPPEDKGISATDIRFRMMDDRPWEHLVSESSASLLKEWKIADRLKDLNQTARNRD